MCQFTKAYTLEVLAQLGEADKALTNPSVEQVLKQTKALNEITQEPLTLIQKTENQSIEIFATTCCTIRRSSSNAFYTFIE